jgi:hypothetical protein
MVTPKTQRTLGQDHTESLADSLKIILGLAQRRCIC